MSQSKGKLIVAALVFATLAMSSLACGGSGDVDAASTKSTFTEAEAEAYWDEANAKEVIRQEAIRRDAVVVEWRGDWNPDAKLALFRGQGHVSDVKVGAQYMDLVERDQIVLKEYKADVNGGYSWATVSNISNNLQPGSTQVFIR